MARGSPHPATAMSASHHRPPALRLCAPAKVNLWLRILHRRDDGFHELQSRLCPLELADLIEFTPLDPGSPLSLTCSDPLLPAGADNLAHRAASAFFEAIERDLDAAAVQLHLIKRIPSGAGLGGGSSDAATVLLGLNQLHDQPLDLPRLEQLAAGIGSDVPFFLHQQPCDVEGRGERVRPVDDFPWHLPLVLVKPAFAIETPWAYRQWQDSREWPGVFYGGQLCPWGELRNDLERPVFAKHLLLAEIKTWLLPQPEVHAALMSGSGSTTFAILRDPTEAAPLVGRLRARYGDTTWLHVTRTIGSAVR